MLLHELLVLMSCADWIHGKNQKLNFHYTCLMLLWVLRVGRAHLCHTSSNAHNCSSLGLTDL